jgi:RNA polymerase sigma-70 factor (ECF subfamily)
MTEQPNAERELVSGMLAGEERAFTAFFDDYFPRIYRFALPRLGGDPDTCKEVVQTTLIKAMRNLASWRGEAALFTWVCQICRREIADHLRSVRRHAGHVVLIEDSPQMRDVFESIAAPASQGPMQMHSAAERRRLIQSVLDRLPVRYGDVLEWKYVDGDSVEQIGERLGIGHTAAQSMLARARTAFREALETVFGATVNDLLSGLPGSE